MRDSRKIVGVTLALTTVVSVLLTGCVLQSEGDRRASDLITALSEKFGSEITPPEINTRDAEYLVATSLPAYQSASAGAPSVTVAPLKWSGSTGTGNGAQIELEFHVEVPSHAATSIGDSSYQAGSSTRCFHYAAIGFRYYDTLSVHEILCPPGEPRAIPSPRPLPALPADADTRLTDVLTSTTAGSLTADVRRAFPQKFIRIESTEVTTGPKTGELVVAIGVPAQFDCMVGVRGASGVTIIPSFDRIQLMPGEEGCTPQLYINPAR
ncbi:hypothetical protein [Lacisediminihabitans sp. H27-G8]|uniref:hypothetical protein n=1 Tax=Lacisediminihabitans sp. H27-G8 TaxID=3111909 RepID=UPI0038FC22A1